MTTVSVSAAVFTPIRMYRAKGSSGQIGSTRLPIEGAGQEGIGHHRGGNFPGTRRGAAAPGPHRPKAFADIPGFAAMREGANGDRHCFGPDVPWPCRVGGADDRRNCPPVGPAGSRNGYRWPEDARL